MQIKERVSRSTLPRPMACALLLLVAACGTTVPAASVVGRVGAGDDLRSPTADSSGPVDIGTAPDGRDTRATSGAPPAFGSVQGPASQVSRPVAGGGVGPAPAIGRAKPVEVGLLVVKDIGAAAAAVGVKDLSTGDGKTQAEASVALLNSRGGLAGHPVRPVIFEQDATQDPETQYQAACAMFFQDNKVKAVVTWALHPILRACAAAAGVPYVTAGTRSAPASVLAQHPLTAVPSQFSLDRVVPTWIASLKAQRYFDPKSTTEQVRIGLVYNGDPDFASVPSLVKNTLAAQGLRIAAEQAIPGADSTTKAPAASSAARNGVLRFQGAGVNRVVVVDKSGQALVSFGRAAASQSYYPTYGLSSLELPSLLRPLLTAEQLQGARGIGWIPATDVPTDRQPPLSANATACIKVLTAAKQDMSASLTRVSALGICDGVLLLGAAWKDPALSAATFLPGLRQLGTAYPSVVALSDDFRSHVDGAATYRPIAYDRACDCFAYHGQAATVA